MAKTEAVWGIDIGQCSLKALRCTKGEDGQVVATAFDLIEYPKILSQPDVKPEELIQEALEQFLSRNEVRGDKVAISVSGQAGLSRFFRPPPVDAKTLPDIVKYEAKQQIPFPLEDVIWDYQQLGGKDVDGVTMDAEVGLFAMKREAVFRALKPFLDADVEVDIVQLSPLTIFNVVLSDVLTKLPDPDEVDPDNPPESLVVVAMGTDTTDLIITDGFRLWLRNIPIGGNHFTKQLSRELKLTYAKAEHIKRNAMKAEDPKTILQAMRPVFGDLVTELQRSLSYFQGLERHAKIGKIAMFGNAANLPGLRKYLTTHLGTDVVKLSGFRSLSGDSVVGTKQFQENILSYATCYGLCLQGLKQSHLKTNLLPQEFVTERLIRAKKPWALAALGALLLGFSIHYAFTYSQWWKVNDDNATDGISWKTAKSDVANVNTLISNFRSQDEEQNKDLKEVHEIENAVTGVTDGRRLWSEALSALYQAMPPYDENGQPIDKEVASVDPMVVPYVDRPDIYVEYVETEFFPQLSQWYTATVKAAAEQDAEAVEYLVNPKGAEEEAEDAAESPAAGPTSPLAPGGPSNFSGNSGSTGISGISGVAGAAATPGGMNGPGWVIEIKGHHYFNGPENRLNGTGDITYVRESVIRAFLDKKFKVRLPMPPGSERPYEEWTLKELGFSHPVVISQTAVDYNNRIPNVNHPNYSPTAGRGGGGAGGSGSGLGGSGSGAPSGGDSSNGDSSNGGSSGDADGQPTKDGEEPLSFDAPRYDFVLQVVWTPTPLSERLEKREAQEKKREERQRNQANGQGAGANNTPLAPGGPNTGVNQGGPAAGAGAQPNQPQNGSDPAAGNNAADNNAATDDAANNGGAAADDNGAAPDNAGDPANGDPANGDPANGDPAAGNGQPAGNGN